MANGESIYEAEKKEVLFAAMWDTPFKTRVRVTNLDNGKSVEVSILDRGPALRLKRTIDLSKAAFEQIANTKQGVIPVEVTVLS